MSGAGGSRLLLVLCLACGTIAQACGGTAASGPGPEQPGGSDEAEAPGEAEATAATLSCLTSEDCADDQICVDSVCVIPVPPGFY